MLCVSGVSVKSVCCDIATLVSERPAQTHDLYNFGRIVTNPQRNQSSFILWLYSLCTSSL